MTDIEIKGFTNNFTNPYDDDRNAFEAFKKVWHALSKAQNIEFFLDEMASDFASGASYYISNLENNRIENEKQENYKLFQEKIRYALDNGIVTEEMIENSLSDYEENNFKKFMEVKF